MALDMAWIQLIIQTKGEHSETIEEQLIELGALAVTLTDNADQPLFEPPPGATPIWEDIRLVGLFEGDTDPQKIVEQLKQTLNIDPFPQYRTEALEDKDWEREWMENYHPMPFGKRLWVCPSWKQPVDPQAVNLLLDPGLAFGTGTHPTTSLCLKWLDGQDLKGKTLVDFGCGSGILAIAGVLLGASQAICIDNDPQALLATRSNAERNGVSEKIQVYAPESAPAEPADFVLANILAGPLIELADTIAAYLKIGGKIALSGILEPQASAVQQAYAHLLSDIAVDTEDEWVRISGTKVDQKT